jgi:nitrile hydratase alpha subunit
LPEPFARGVHDLGGLPGAPIDRREHDLYRWEKAADATLRCVSELGVRIDEFRRAIEELPPGTYRHLSYYERWIASLHAVSLRRGFLTREEVSARVAQIRRDRGEHAAAADRHHHDHDHDHHADEEGDDGEYPVLGDALRQLLIEKGLFSAARHRAVLERMDSITPSRGAAVVARAWQDPGFREALLRDGKAACISAGIEMPESAHLVVVENTPSEHNVVVCTLCSCYPIFLLGRPPDWYKSAAYRSRVVREPRAVLEEFGTPIAPGRAIRVHDSTADMRYLVLPMRPEGTQGWSEDKLRALVTRDTMIGVAECSAP